ncbi:MAG: hypothetical protein ACREAG_04735 [Nitrosopumilaceae archaeon]
MYDGIEPDMYDVIGALVALVGVLIIFYVPRKGEKVWSK